MNLVLELTKRTKRLYLTCIKGTIDRKFGCNMKLQRNEEKAKSKSVLTDIQKRPKVDPKSEEEETINVNIMFLPARLQTLVTPVTSPRAPE